MNDPLRKSAMNSPLLCGNELPGLGGFRIVEDGGIPWREPKNPEMAITPKWWLSETDRHAMNDWLMTRFGWKESPAVIDNARRVIYCNPSMAQTLKRTLP